LATVQEKRQKARERRRKKARETSSGVADPDSNAHAAQPRKKSRLREWIDALVFAVVVMLIVRTLIFDLFRIPTPSMEKNLLVGDYLFVSKLHYGTRTPVSVGIPFTRVYIPGFTLPNTRLPGFSEVERGDAIVFNWPDDVGYPTDRKTHYIKRVVGLPGERVSLIDKVVHIDGEPLPLSDGMQQWWNVYKKDPRVRLSQSALARLDVSAIRPTQNPSIVQIVATPEAVRDMSEWPWVDRIEPYVSSFRPEKPLYPGNPDYSTDNYGPLLIPEGGVSYELTEENWAGFELAIRRYEGHTTGRGDDGSFLIDGNPATSFTFRQDYFFVMGDYRDNSEDSRFWGFVPMDHIVGKAVLVYFSWNADAKLPRFSRLFKVID
jgi:signal peptidase I